MDKISNSLPKVDHGIKITGQAQYVCDYPAHEMLCGKILRSSIPKGIVRSVRLPRLPGGYFYVDKNDVPAANEVHIVQDDTPVFTDHVEYIGEPIGMLVGPCERTLSDLLEQTVVDYEQLPGIFDANKSDVVFFEYNVDKGDTDTAFKEADKVFEFNYETGLQEHMYLEVNGLIARAADGKIYIQGSLQCPYYIHTALVHAFGYKPEDVIIKQDVTGGGFGGKEDYPSVLACQAAAAALKAGGKPVRVVLDREEDIISTPKRHPSFCSFKVAVKDNRISGICADLLLDAGAYTTLSMVVLQRATFGSCGVYNIPNIKIHSRACKTNTVPSGAFRGFGGPQAFFAIEMCMTHVASQLGIDSIDFKRSHFAKQGDLTSTSGVYHFPVPLNEMTDDILHESGYRNKQEKYKKQTGRYRRGLGFSAVYHGAGFTGNGERDIIGAVVKLHKKPDGTVDILTAGTDMGQGLFTTLSKIVATTLDISPQRVSIDLPDTSIVPDSGPTIASRSIMVVGELLRRASLRLKDEWVDGKEQIVEQKYEHPGFLISFDSEKLRGDAYPTYSWAVTAAEVEVDTLTGLISVTGAWGCYDIGTIIDENIVIGQMEGGIVQSLGYAVMEKLTAVDGKLNNTKFCDYIIPTAMDFKNVKVIFRTAQYPEGPYGAKGAGELPHVGGAAAVIEAVQNALGTRLNKAPFLPEDVIETLRKGGC